MNEKITLHNKSVEVRLTPAARQQLQQRQNDLLAEAELYFSCLIRKKMRFYETLQNDSEFIPVCDHLRLRFHPIMTAKCGNDYEGDEPPVTDFPIEKPEAYIPKWVKIDYQSGQWQGDFGY